MFRQLVTPVILAALGSAGVIDGDNPNTAVLSISEGIQEGWIYQGCWTGDLESLSDQTPNVDFDNMTQEACTLSCESQGSSSAALTKRGECFCWDHMSVAPNVLTQLNEDECNLPCAGNQDQACGAENQEHAVIFVQDQALQESDEKWSESEDDTQSAELGALDAQGGCPKCHRCRPCPRPCPYPPPPGRLYPTSWNSASSTSDSSTVSVISHQTGG